MGRIPRADNDTWDLATGVGATATAAAAGRAVASRRSDPLIDDPFAEPLVHAVGINFYSRVASGDLDPADVDAGHDDPSFGLGRMCDMMAARTCYFDEFLAAAAESGIRQLVILASGLDARAYRIQWPAGTVLYEVDQQSVIEFKTRTLASLGAAPTVEHRPVSCDLRNDWPAALTLAGFEPSSPTVWIAEGLLPFLSPEAQDQLLETVTALSAPTSRLAAENIPSNLGEVSDRLTAATRHWCSHGLEEEWDGLWYPGEHRDVAEFLSSRRWGTSVSGGAKLFAARGLGTHQKHDSDPAAILNSLTYVSAVRY